MYVICFVGAEGVGKTFATEFFAQKLGVGFAIEYGNFYCQNVLSGYFQSNKFLTTKKDFAKIVQEQKEIWEKVMADNQKQQFCFFDTDYIFTKYFIDKQFISWNWIDEYIKNQPIDLFIFLKSNNITFKQQHLINPDTIQKETRTLLNYYSRFVTSQLVVVESDNYQERQEKILQIILYFLKSYGIQTTIKS